MPGRNIIARGLEYLALACAGLSALGLATIVGLIVTSVLMRRIFNQPLYITEEVVGLLMSVCLFLGLPLVTIRGTHVKVSILTTHLEDRHRRAFVTLTILAALVGVVFCAWLAVESVPWLEFALKRNLRTETSRVLLAPWMMALPVSVALTGLIFLWRLVERVAHAFGAEPRPGDT
jgi:TRAP-type C4-dicarboxylate transport system permease small subunit